MKTYTYLSLTALFLVVFSMRDDMWSFFYLLKIIPAAVFMVISGVMIIQELRAKKNRAQLQKADLPVNR